LSPLSALKPGWFTLLSEIKAKVVENIHQGLLYTNWTVEYGGKLSFLLCFCKCLAIFFFQQEPLCKSDLIKTILKLLKLHHLVLFSASSRVRAWSLSEPGSSAGQIYSEGRAPGPGASWRWDTPLQNHGTHLRPAAI